MSSGYDQLREGSRLGPYELLLAVAQGGMARVWAARHEPTNTVVAVKTIRPEFATNRTYQRLFQDEARFASAVRHPSVCVIHGIGEQNGVLYIAMEWVVGESVARILKPTKDDEVTPIEPRIAAKIIADSCSALHAAHEVRDEGGSLVRLVHCDVSPQNLMITSDGRAKLVDFGVARAAAGIKMSDVPQIDGKAAYMAPEHAAGKRISRLSDVFTLGICLYEITTGARPFATGSREGTLDRLLRGDYQVPGDLIEDYPAALERIVLRAMAMEPAHRYPSALRMRAALEEWLVYSGPKLTELDLAQFLAQRAGHIIQDREAAIASAMRGSFY